MGLERVRHSTLTPSCSVSRARFIQAKKGDDIATFLEKCRLQFPELRGTSVDNLMYIKVRHTLARSLRLNSLSRWSADASSPHRNVPIFRRISSSLMHVLCSLLRPCSARSHFAFTDPLLVFPAPQHYTFYDFIVNKARGKSGPLFNFDVHDDVRMIHDATVEKDESHAGKVVERSWYNRSVRLSPFARR